MTQLSRSLILCSERRAFTRRNCLTAEEKNNGMCWDDIYLTRLIARFPEKQPRTTARLAATVRVQRREMLLRTKNTSLRSFQECVRRPHDYRMFVRAHRRVSV